MKSKNSNVTTIKSHINKCENDVCITNSVIQTKGTEFLASLGEIVSFKTNVPFIAADGKEYTSDILAVTIDGSPVIAECIALKLLANAKYLQKLELSYEYWIGHGVTDWRILAVDDEVTT